MGSALLNMRRLKNCIIIIWSFLLVAFSIIISSDGVGKLENVLLLALPMTLFCFFGYVAMRSWKFGVAFPICVAFVIYYMFPVEYVYTLFFLLYIEFFFVCVNFIKDNPYRNYVIAILFVYDLALLLVSLLSAQDDVLGFENIYILNGAETTFVLVSAIFFLFTIIRKRKRIINIIFYYWKYIFLFVIFFVGAVASVLVIGTYGIKLCSMLIILFVASIDYILLTMWWHPGHYYKALPQENTHRFDTYANDYRQLHTENVKKLSGEDSDYFTIYKLAEIKEYICDNAKFLDFGCGDGNTGKHFYDFYESANYYGIDISEESINKAIKRGLEKCCFQSYDGKNIPFEDDYFDVIYMATVLHHIKTEDRIEILAECKRVLKPGGKIIIFEHNPWNILTCNTVDKCEFDEDALLVSPLDTCLDLGVAQYTHIRTRFTLFMPRTGVFEKFLPLEKNLRWCPIGAQYYCTASK